MKKLFTFIFSLLMAISAIQARVVPVATPGEFSAAYAASMDGDTLALQSGTYTNEITFFSDKSVTIYAADTSRVSFYGIKFRNGSSKNNSSLSLEGITFGGVDYLVSAADGHMKKLSFKNCVIKDLSRCFYYGNQNDANLSQSSLDSLILRNCIITNCNTGNWNMIYAKENIHNILMEENTFYKNDGVESFYNPRSTIEGESHNFTFCKNTVYQGQRDTTRAFCNIKSSYTGEESTFTFEDNLVITPTGKVSGSFVNASMGTLTAKNNLVVGYDKPRYKIENEFSGEEPTDLTLESFGLNINEIFADPANGNFTIYNTSPLATAAQNGGIIGASRWLKQATTLYTLTTGLATGTDSIAGSISGPKGKVEENTEVSLTATNNYGYRFSKWVDENGTTLSDTTVYIFKMTSNKNIYAVFTSVPLYKLNLTISGDGPGDVLISETGKDGKYEYYESGTVLTLTAKSNPVSEFLFWDYEDSSNTKTIVMSGDVDVDAYFSAKSFIVGWDFNLTRGNTGSNNREADFKGKSINPEDIPTLSMHWTANPDGEDMPYSGWWNRSEADRPAAVPWKNYSNRKQENGEWVLDETKPLEAFYYKTRISTKGYKDIEVMFSLVGRYHGYNSFKLEYSYNNISWEKAGEAPIGTSWADYKFTIENTSDKENVYLRFIPDFTSGARGSIKDVDGTYITDIFVLADPISGKQDAQKDLNAPKTYVQNGNLYVTNIQGSALVQLISANGSTIYNDVANDNCMINVQMLKGIYILRVGEYSTKVAL